MDVMMEVSLDRCSDRDVVGWMLRWGWGGWVLGWGGIQWMLRGWGGWKMQQDAQGVDGWKWIDGTKQEEMIGRMGLKLERRWQE